MSTTNGVPFSLSQYEETKQRMKQLQLEQQRQRQIAAQAAAAAAAAVTPALEAKDQSTGASSSARPRTERLGSFGREGSKSAASSRTALSSRDTATANSGSTAATAQPRASPTLVRAGSARSTSSAAAVVTSAASSASANLTASNLTRVPSVSMYSPLSPRSTLKPHDPWTSQTSASTLQSAIAVNHAAATSVGSGLSSPRSRSGGDIAPDTLQTTAPFAVASASPKTSQPNTPKNHVATASSGSSSANNPSDPLQPVQLSIPQPPSISADPSSVLSDSVFNSKLDSLFIALSSTVTSLGLKYSLDSKLKLLRHEVEKSHSAEVKQAQEQCAQVQQQWAAAAQKVEETRERYEMELLKARTHLLDVKRKVEKQHTVEVRKAVKEQEALLRGEYLEKSKKFEGIEKYNEVKLKQLEDSVRAQVKAQMQSETKRTRSMEDQLAQQLAALEESGARMVQEKEQELVRLKEKQQEVDSRCKELQQREKTWEKKYERERSEKAKIQDELNSLRIELAQARQDNTAMVSKLDQLRDAGLNQERLSTEQASKLTNRIMDLVQEVEQLKQEQKDLVEDGRKEKERTELAVAQMKQKHVQELDTIQTKISVVLQKKDEQIAQLKHKLQEQVIRVKDIERELGGI